MSKDATAFLRAHPDLEFVDLLMPDLNAILRGKKIAAQHAAKSLAEGVLLPRSIFGTDVCGDTVDETDMGMTTGDRDYVCMPAVVIVRRTNWIVFSLLPPPNESLLQTLTAPPLTVTVL